MLPNSSNKLLRHRNKRQGSRGHGEPRNVTYLSTKVAFSFKPPIFFFAVLPEHGQCAPRGSWLSSGDANENGSLHEGEDQGVIGEKPIKDKNTGTSTLTSRGNRRSSYAPKLELAPAVTSAGYISFLTTAAGTTIEDLEAGQVSEQPFLQGSNPCALDVLQQHPSVTEAQNMEPELTGMGELPLEWCVFSLE